MKIKVCRLKSHYKSINVSDDFTSVQLKYINSIEEYKKKNKAVPSIRDIDRLVNANSSATAYTMMQRLKEKGYDYREI